MKVKIGVSARHVHLCEKDFEYLFGSKSGLTKKDDLTQTGEYSCYETVTIKTKEDKIENVRILGPLRDYTQIEISKTDAHNLGINPPVRNSGDIKGSEAITICYKDKEIAKEEGCIIATRHIHMSTRDAFKLGFRSNQKVKVKIKGEKGGILENVYIKVKDSFVYELHLDVDDANAHLISTGDVGEVIINE